MLTALVAAVLPISADAERPLLLAHTMPWFSFTSPDGAGWGWHWTMGKTRAPEQLASHYRPLIGPYDSSDRDTVMCQVLLMKLAGLDGVLADWYGSEDHFDYGQIHRNTELLFRIAKQADLKFGLVYEDQSVPQLIKAGKFQANEATTRGRRLFNEVDDAWFADPQYLREEGRPLLLVFGPQHYDGEAWREVLASVSKRPMLYTLHEQKTPADGAFDWPLPKSGNDADRRKFNRRPFDRAIPVAYPRFHDYYAEAGLHPSYGRIPDDDGKTFEVSLAEAVALKPKFVQIATWNDWGEGTQIEPSREFGYRDLEAIQRQRRKMGTFPFKAEDLRLPVEIYRMHKAKRSPAELMKAEAALCRGDTGRARSILAKLAKRP
jgi:hypothetical protein